MRVVFEHRTRCFDAEYVCSRCELHPAAMQSTFESDVEYKNFDLNVKKNIYHRLSIHFRKIDVVANM